MMIGDSVYTPRFLTVTIKEILSRQEAREKGYTEPTHFMDANYDILGKHTSFNHMVFAAVFKGDAKPLKCAHCGTHTSPNDGEPERGSIFTCELCGEEFCTACFEDKTSLSVGEAMRNNRCICPDCREPHLREYFVTFVRAGGAIVRAMSEDEARRIADATVSQDEVNWNDDWPATHAELFEQDIE